MSVIRKLPYIEALLASMTAANLKDLRTVLNTGGSNVNLDFEHLNAATYKNKVTPVYFKFEDNGLKTGILIWTNSMCALICYHRFQDLIIFELSPTYHTSKKINEYCDINELRRVLDDTLESTGAIDSGSAAAGAVPFADGDGGVDWNKPVDYIKGSDFPEGSTSVKMIAIDDNGDLVKVGIPEGTVVVDSALSDLSENPVQNKVITEKFADLDGKIIETENGKKYKIVAGVLRNYNGTWDLIGDDHSSINIDHISQTSRFVQVHYKFEAKKVVSFVACPDEDFGKLGYFIGSSVGTEVANIEINKGVNAGGYIAWTGTEFNCSGDITNASMDTDTGLITITHKDTGSQLGRSVQVRDGIYIGCPGSAGDTQDKISLKDYSGVTITTPNTDFKIYWIATGECMTVNPANANQSGNIWCFGIMEIDEEVANDNED